jgi:enoyl-CoA hydratase
MNTDPNSRPSETPAVQVEAMQGFVLARLEHPPANPLGPAVLEGLDLAADAVESTGAKALVIVSALPGFFAAGADIKHMRSLDADGFAAYGEHMRRRDRTATRRLVDARRGRDPALRRVRIDR